MNVPSAPSNPSALMKQALLEIRDLKARLAARDQRDSEPIAITGMACRFPGHSDDVAAFRQLLLAAQEGRVEVPADRWPVDLYYDANPDQPGRIYTRWAHFLDLVDQFDPGFFGLSEREAMAMDPQQRLLLEVAWEALENAGIPPASQRGSKTGAFVGMVTQDYMTLSLNPMTMDIHTATGNAISVASGRLAYVFGWRGPAITLDTACSSSLVSVHLACQCLRIGECDQAVAGGVNMMLAPYLSLMECRAKMLAPDGRCKTFDAAADGYARGEGCGLVVLERLSDALSHHRHIWAVIRGSAVNHDGRSSGLTVPNPVAQEEVIRAALSQAGLSPADVSYVEAHGTGTVLGDPIEIEALSQVFHSGHDQEHPLWVGSVKTNIGHLEAAAGIAGLIKAALSVHDGIVLPHLNLQRPNPRIDWRQGQLVIPTGCIPWPRGKRRVAGVSAFGFSGTNAHVLVEAVSVHEPGTGVADVWPGPPWGLPLSAPSERALNALAGRYAAFIRSYPGVPLRDICHTAAVGRDHFQNRLVAGGQNRDELLSMLSRMAQGERPAVKSDFLPAWAPHYLNGETVDWCLCVDLAPGRIVSLPTYPFQRSRYWLTETSRVDALKTSDRVEISPVVPESEGRQVPDLVALAASAMADVSAHEDAVQSRAYQEALQDLDALSLRYVIDTFQDLDVEWTLGHRFEPQHVFKSHALVPRYERLFMRLVDMLVRAGIVLREGETVRIVGKASPLPFSGRCAQQAAAEFTLLDRCGPRLAEALRGQCHALELLFPQGDLSATTALYESSPGVAATHRILTCVLASLVRQRSGRTPLHVLEVGAGTGGTTAHVLPQFRDTSVRYLFTDVTPMFLTQAKTKFASFPFVDYRLLDVERDPLDQGFERGSQDVIVAANVLHATRDLRQSVAHIRSLLRSGGLLFLLEGSGPVPWVDLIFGLTDGWWRFQDTELRPDYPLLAPDRWQQLLADSGFDDVVILPPAEQRQGLLSLQVAIIGRADGRGAGDSDDGRAGDVQSGSVSTQGSFELQSTLRMDLPAPADFDSWVRRVRQQVAGVLGTHDPDRIPLDKGFFDLGLDSLTSMELKGRLQKALRLELPSTLAFDYPTVRLLSDYLALRLWKTATPESAPEPRGAADIQAQATDVSVMSESEAEAALLGTLQKLEAQPDPSSARGPG